MSIHPFTQITTNSKRVELPRTTVVPTHRPGLVVLLASEEPREEDQRQHAAPPAPKRSLESVPGAGDRWPTHEVPIASRTDHSDWSPRSCSAVRAAPSPHMPCTPPPGGVDAEQM